MQPMNHLLSATGTTIFTVMSALAVQHGAINLGQGFPDYDGPADVIEAAAAALNPAMQAFSQGVRTYYFALAAAAWLFGPLWLGGGALAVLALLIWHQADSPAARAVRVARRLLP